MTPRRARVRTAAALTLVALFAVACGDDEQADTGDTSTSEETTSSTAAETTTSEATTPPTTEATTMPPTSAPDCVLMSEGGSAESSASGDIDGDGQDDTLEVRHDSAGSWFLVATLADGTRPALELVTDNVGGAEMIGAADIDGDGKEELFVQTGAGASSAVIGLFTLDGCTIAPITFDGSPAQFPVGASMGATSGLQCSNAPEPPAIFAFAGASSDGQTYDVTTAELQLGGTVLTQVGETTGTANYGDELYTAASTFHCDDTTYGA